MIGIARLLELHWAAGLFDGDGTATICRGRPRLAVQCNDEELVRRFAEAVGCGRRYGPYEGYAADGFTRKSRFVWLAEGDDYVTVARMLMPLVCEAKREAMAKNVETVTA